MNYYEHHIGDYAAATSHLSFVEDAAYSRLMRIYYRDEKALPLELKAVQRLVGARTREEKEAVDTVLNEFFRASDDGWHSKRCDEEIAKVQEKREKARRSAEARWRPACERIDSDMRTHSPSNANASETHNGRNAHHTPDTSHQTEATAGTTHTTGQATGVGGTASGHASAAMNRAGCRITSQNPNLIAACAEGVTTEHLLELVKQFPDKPAGYVIAAARREHAERAKPNGATRGTDQPRESLADRAARRATEIFERTGTG